MFKRTVGRDWQRSLTDVLWDGFEMKQTNYVGFLEGRMKADRRNGGGKR